MVLAQAELRASVEAKEIRFDPPLEENQWGQASVDLRLGFSFTKIKQDLKGVKVSIADGLGELGEMGFWKTIELKERDDLGKLQTFSLEPGEFVLAMTYERITIPSNLVAIVGGRSTDARAGISMHQTAPLASTGLVWPYCIGNGESGASDHRTHAQKRPSVPIIFFQINERLTS